MRVEARERGVIDPVPIEELIDKTSDKDSNEGREYLKFIRESIRRMLFFNVRYPFIKKVSGATAKIQITAHMHIYDSLQGYWERNKDVYVHRARSDYRALYIGTIHMLEEETQLKGVDNSKEISKLKLFLEESGERHKRYRDIAALRSQIKLCLTEQSSGDISQDVFEDEMERLTKAYTEIVGNRHKAIDTISDLIKEEDVKTGNRVRQAKHREYEQKVKGIREV